MGAVMTALERSRERIVPPECWSIGHEAGAGAVTAAGEMVDAQSPDAVRWCAIGALRSVIPKPDPLYPICLHYIWRGTKEYHETTNLHEENHGMVLSVYDRAIRMAKEDGV